MLVRVSFALLWLFFARRLRLLIPRSRSYALSRIACRMRSLLSRYRDRPVSII
jgi:hypothetical protein